MASQVSSQVTSRLQKALGVSQISVDPQLGATNGNQQQGARMTVRQRVTSKLYVTFSTDVTTTQFSAVQMQYQINRKWSVKRSARPEWRLRTGRQVPQGFLGSSAERRAGREAAPVSSDLAGIGAFATRSGGQKNAEAGSGFAGG